MPTILRSKSAVVDWLRQHPDMIVVLITTEHGYIQPSVGDDRERRDAWLDATAIDEIIEDHRPDLEEADECSCYVLAKSQAVHQSTPG